MSWAMHHTESEQLASNAELALRSGDRATARSLYGEAAVMETEALHSLPPSKTRTIGITAVSAAALWYKAGEYQQAELVAYQYLGVATLPSFARVQLEELLRYSWTERSRIAAGIEFLEGQVMFSVSGGQVIIGAAPLELIQMKVEEVDRLFVRTVEMMLGQPLRRRGVPEPRIREQFTPWLFQAPPGSYQFAVRVERPKQMSLFPEFDPTTAAITNTFMRVVRATAESPMDLLPHVVNDPGYRDVFLKLTKNLIPTGKTIGKMELKAIGEDAPPPIVLTPETRETIKAAIREMSPTSGDRERDSKEPELITGVLRGLQLDRDWIEVNAADGVRRIYDAGEVIDDVVGPMVNHRVVVEAYRDKKGRLVFKDIQAEE